MSGPRLHDSLLILFENKDRTHLEKCLRHEDYSRFLKQHEINIPLQELSQAFTHTSFSHEFDVPHQELLEFLGDAVLQLILTGELYLRKGSEKEGTLSKLRSTIVNEKSLAELARSLGLPELILVGKGEFKKNLFEQDTVLADTMEALLGVIYKHCGFEFTKDKTLNWLEARFPELWEMKSLESFDPKSALQEKSLGKYKKLPVYSAEQRGERFIVRVEVNGEKLAEGEFLSKKAGEKELAAKILKENLI